MAYNFTDDYKRVEKIIKQFVATPTDLNVYTHRSDFIKPAGQYATVWINDIEPLGMDHQRLGLDDLGRRESAILYKVTATVTVIRSPSKPQMISIISSLETPEYERSLSEENNIMLLKKGIVTDSSAPIDGDKWEERCSTILEFNTYFTYTEPTPLEYIENVEISKGDISDQDGNNLTTIETVITYP